MIPKVIHYCWFGGNPKPKLAEKCIQSWRKFCPDYEIIEWNENNFDIASAPLYVRQAYAAKKWAFLTDYVRLQVVYENGGIYMDTDVELKKNLDFLLCHRAYFGFEAGRYIATGLGFGAEKGTPILRELMEDYASIPFVKEDGTFDSTPCPRRNTEVFLRHGLVQNDQIQTLSGDLLILSSIYLCPMDFETKKKQKSPDTVSIHWFDSSWQSAEERDFCERLARQQRKERSLNRVKQQFKNVVGEKGYQTLKKLLGRESEEFSGD